ncbi:MAG: LAO/AO transport system kinase, partial [Kiritimatiellia bacterium]
AQRTAWMWGMVESEVIRRLRAHPTVRELAETLQSQVHSGSRSPTSAAWELLDAFSNE